MLPLGSRENVVGAEIPVPKIDTEYEKPPQTVESCRVCEVLSVKLAKLPYKALAVKQVTLIGATGVEVTVLGLQVCPILSPTNSLKVLSETEVIFRPAITTAFILISYIPCLSFEVKGATVNIPLESIKSAKVGAYI